MKSRWSVFAGWLACCAALAPGAHAQPGDAASPTVAKVGDVEITEAQMRGALGLGLYEMEMQVHGMKTQWLNDRAKAILFEKAAKAAGQTLPQWKNQMVEAKLTAPTAEDVDAMVRQMTGGRTIEDAAQLEPMKKQATEHLLTQRRSARENEVFQELAQKTPVEIALQAPVRPEIEITVPDYTPVKGPKNAPVTIVEFTDFQCPWCKRSQESVKEVEKAYGGKVRFAARHFPLAMHPQAKPAAEASVCAADQKKFWEMREKLFDNQSQLGEADIERYARDIGLNMKRFTKCLASGKADEIIRTDLADGQRFGVRGTPSFFVNGEPVGFPQLKDAVARELEKAK